MPKEMRVHKREVVAVIAGQQIDRALCAAVTCTKAPAGVLSDQDSWVTCPMCREILEHRLELVKHEAKFFDSETGGDQ